ncbi:Pkinase-domain-containing protein [Coprinopsis marcescibilis]|uniref:Pkinase-domain-containing protein n=1 Tax=Coprinopsis marcescibilis TaxID=230819 RepID=A0A5C3KL53_COPMA|nr:Pkinase-domain-containing protein [Coprinopsis marcescibilis]
MAIITLAPLLDNSQPLSPIIVDSVETAFVSLKLATEEPANSASTASVHQSPNRIASSTPASSAEVLSSPFSISKLLSNYPPRRQHTNINKRHQNLRLQTCLSSTSSSPRSSKYQSQDMKQRFRPPLARQKSAQGRAAGSPFAKARFTLSNGGETSARRYSTHFPEGHQLDAEFVEAYQLQYELGSGGYGFVMTATDMYEGSEVAVKFIIKDKVPEYAWIDDPNFGRLPMEVVLLSFVNHENIVKCLDVFQDSVYFYLVQELHGSPWNRTQGYTLDWPSEGESSTALSTPSLSPSTSESSLQLDSPLTPPHHYPSLPASFSETSSSSCSSDESPYPVDFGKAEVCRRSSHDLFECIEQSERKRLTEEQARYVFAQVVDAISYLDELGISHRDIKDENLVIDHNLQIKLIDFGSATIVDPSKARPYYDQFYGTAAYASSEILLKKKYKAAPAEVWTLGVLLSYLLAGVSPFPTVRDAVEGNIFLSESLGLKPSESAMDLVRACLDPNPDTRITIARVRDHPWLHEPSPVQL